MQSGFKRFIKRLAKEKDGYLFVLPQLLLFLIFMIYPIFSGFRLSLYKISNTKETFIGLRNYARLFADENFILAIKNTVLFVVSISALSIVAGIIVSAAIFDKSPRYISLVRTCYYLPVAVSMVVMSSIWSFLFNPASGLINYLIGLLGYEPVNWFGNPNLVMPIIIFVTFVSRIGQVIVLYVAAMIGIPNDLFEVAEIDGASRVNRFFHIILPLVKPTSVYVIITQTIDIMKIFIVIQLLTNGGPNYRSTTLMFYLYEKAFRMTGKFGEAAAVGVIMFIICLMLSLIQFMGMNAGSRRERRHAK